MCYVTRAEAMLAIVAGLERCVFLFKHKTAYELRISDWSSDVCSSDLQALVINIKTMRAGRCVEIRTVNEQRDPFLTVELHVLSFDEPRVNGITSLARLSRSGQNDCRSLRVGGDQTGEYRQSHSRSKEHTSELHSLMRI